MIKFLLKNLILSVRNTNNRCSFESNLEGVNFTYDKR